MTVTLVSQPRRFTGVAADTKPTDAPAGSHFVERDSGREYVWDGTAWGQLLGAGAQVATDDAAFTPGSGLVLPFGAVADETSPDSVDEGDVGAVRMTLDRMLRVLSGGRYSSTLPTLSNGDNSQHQLNVRGGLVIALDEARLINYLTAGSDGASNSVSSPYAAPQTFNYSSHWSGVGWDRVRNAVELTAFASAARTADPTDYRITMYNLSRIYIVFDITVAPGGDSVNLRLKSVDPVSGGEPRIIESGALTTTGTRRYIVGPGAADLWTDATADLQAPLPRTLDIGVVHSGAGSFTYSVGVVLMV